VVEQGVRDVGVELGSQGVQEILAGDSEPAFESEAKAAVCAG
jgi:hypothetical protein